jgi:Flp pilus assembly protein TadG
MTGTPLGARLRRRWARPRDDSGAVALLVGLMSTVLVVVAAFAVDLGMQRVVRSDMQALADTVALDVARLLDGRTAAEILAGDLTHDPLDEVLADSVARNQTQLGDVVDVEATLVTLTTDHLGAIVALTDASGDPAPVAGNVVPDAVAVRAEGEVDFAFSTGTGGATRSSIANAATFACFRIGSFAAALETGGTPVAGVFEAVIKDALGLNLNAIGYQGLLATTVDLGDLAAELGVGTTEELAELDALEVDELIGAYARVLGNDGNTAAQTEVAQMAQNITSTLTLDAGEVLTTGAGSVLQGRVNIIDLLGSAALGVATQVSNSNNFLDTGVAWATPHVAQGNIELTAIEPPQQACGPVGTQAHTAQVEFNAALAFNLPNKLGLGGLGSLDVSIPDNTSSTAGTITLNASLAGATGTLESATCGSGTVQDPDGIHVSVDTGLVSSSATLPFRLTGTLDTTSSSSILPLPVLDSLVSALFGLISKIAKVELLVDIRAVNTATLTTPASTAVAPTSYMVPPRDYTDVEPTGVGGPVAIPTPAVQVDAASTVKLRVTIKNLFGGTEVDETLVEVSSLDLSPILSAVTSSVIGTSSAQVVTNVNKAISPVSTLLGIRTAGADLLGVSAPECGLPSLVG